MQWKVTPQDFELQKFLAAELQISVVTAQALINRGIKHPENAKKFIYPTLQHLHDPFLIPDMEKAVERIIKAIEKEEKITVYGDYDTDGVCSTAVILKFFKEIGLDVDYYIPHRIKDGYGLNNDAVKRIALSGTRLIITVDNGINANEQVALARTLGIDLVITDHHEPQGILPPAVAVVNPKRADSKFHFRELSGVGVAFNLIMALRQSLRESGFFEGKTEPRLREYLDIVAVGTVADVVPLLDENRIFVKFGLEELKKTSTRGLSALKIISGLENHQIDSTAVAFRIAPRINAAGRIDDQNLGVELLTTSSPEKAAQIAQMLSQANSRRQAIEESILKEITQIFKTDSSFNESMGLTLAKEGWHPGVIGIVATRIAENQKKPTVVFAIDGEIARGSARSVGDYNMMSALESCRDLLVRFGGHRHAAGLTINTGKIEEFRKCFDEVVSDTLTEEDRSEHIYVDAEIDPDHINDALISELELLAPFGEGNPEPVFCMRDLKVSDSRVVKEKHLKLKFSDNLVALDAIGFGMAEHNVVEDDILDVAFVPQRDDWKGNGAVQLKLKDIKR